MKIGIIREGKTPADSRVPLSPKQCSQLVAQGFQVNVQRSEVRCFADDKYSILGINVVDTIDDCDILLGVKEVPISELIPNKTYFFFSHTIKEQAYNQKLLKACVDKKIRLIDYEVLTDETGKRVIAFGKFAGMVGAHNALWTYGERQGNNPISRMHSLRDYAEAKEIYRTTNFPNVRIVLTGTGRVSGGAAQVLVDMGIKQVRPIDFVTQKYEIPVFTQLSSFYYAKRKDGKEFDSVQNFYDHPEDYESDFHHFLPHADILINGIYWDNKAPVFFTAEEMTHSNFNIKVIADVTCDIAPVSSIPSTLKASTIADPVFGYNPKSRAETKPYTKESIDMMTIDNLPNELPRDASVAFGSMFIEHVLPELVNEESEILDKATITKNGDLGSHFEYLRNYLESN